MKEYTPREFLLQEDPAPLETIEPLQLFDDLYYCGHKLLGFWILKTSEGLVLFDSGDLNEGWEKWLEPALRKFGLQDEPVKMLFLTHGHFDHYLGARKVWEKTDCDIALSREDTIYMMGSVDNRDKEPVFPPITRFVEDGEDLTFGDHTVRVIFAPGHTPGCLNYSFPVHDNGEEHRVIMAGGYGVFGPGFFPGGEYPYGVNFAVTQAFTFAASLAKTWEYVKETGCDVYLNPHPHLCRVLEYAEENKDRKPGDPNGVVIGQEGVRKWLQERFDVCLERALEFTDIRKEYSE